MAINNQKNINNGIRLILLLLVYTCSFAIAYSDISADFYYFDGNNYVKESDDFIIHLDENDNAYNKISFKLDIDKGNYTYMEDVSAILLIEEFNPICEDDAEIANTNLIMDIASSDKNEYYDVLKTIVTSDKICRYDDVELRYDYDKLSNQIKTVYFDIKADKILEGDFDYELKVYGRDENDNSIRAKQTGTITITREEDYEVDVTKVIGYVDCKDVTKSKFGYNMVIDFYKYGTYDNCVVEIKPRQYDQFGHYIKKFYIYDESEDLLDRTEKHYSINITAELDKHINKTTGLYSRVYCMFEGSQYELQNSWTDMPFSCDYDASLDDAITGTKPADTTQATDSTNAAVDNTTTSTENDSHSTAQSDNAQQAEAKGFFARIWNFFKGLFS